MMAPLGFPVIRKAERSEDFGAGSMSCNAVCGTVCKYNAALLPESGGEAFCEGRQRSLFRKGGIRQSRYCKFMITNTNRALQALINTPPHQDRC